LVQAIRDKKIAIVCNPLAGGGRAIALAENIQRELVYRNIPNEIFSDHWPPDLTGHTEVFIVGGDGTLNYFINHYPQIKIPLVIFKGGSGNDVHWMLYGNKNFQEQLMLVLSTEPKPVDAGTCNQRLFINGVGAGFDGAVAKSLAGKKKVPGKTSFLIAILKKIFFYRSQSYNIFSGEIKKEDRYLLIGVANGRRAGGGFHIAPEAGVNDGSLDVVLVRAIPPLQRLRYLPVIEKGKHIGLSFIQYFKAKEICISSDTPMQAHLDGECCSAYKLDIKILPAQFLFLY